MLQSGCCSSNATALEAVGMAKQKAKANYRRTVLRLPDLDHSKVAVLNSLTSPFKQALDQWTSAAGIVDAESSEVWARPGGCGDKASRRTWCGTSCKAAAEGQVWSTSPLTTCEEPVPSFAIVTVESWNKFNSCWGMHLCRQPNAIWDASKTWDIR